MGDAEDAGQQAELGFFPRALGLVLLVGLSHFVLAHVLLAPLATEPGPWLGEGPRLAVTIVVAATSLLQLAGLSLRASAGGAYRLSMELPRVLRFAPPLLCVAAIPIAYEPHLLADGWEASVLRTLPVVATTWSTGLAAALVEERMLHGAALRLALRAEKDIPVARAVGLPGGFARAIGWPSLAAAILAIAVMVTHGRNMLPVSSDPRTMLAVTSMIVVAILATVSGASLGFGPSRAISSISTRLDALGRDPAQRMSHRIRATSFDEIGAMFVELERLRLRLSKDAAMYREALERTRTADARKAQFLASVSHELRTPLNSIIGFAQLLLEGSASAPLTEAQAEDVRLIKAGGHQLLALINDILDISMIESGELSLSFAIHDLESLIEEVVSIHQPLVRDKEVELKVDLTPDLPRITCDRRRIGQVLTNLLSNAIKFTEEGSITVRARFDINRGRVRVEVIDTGVGIAEDEVEQIFQVYKQVGSLKRRAKGTGLGLAIARSIATHHSGALGATSKMGQGSTFWLELPVDPARLPSSIDMRREAARAKEALDQEAAPAEGGAA